MKYSTVDTLIYKYRMLGFDKPKIEYNNYFKCITLEVNDCCGQWKLIKGNSDYSCLIGALKWSEANWKKIQRDRKNLEMEYIAVKRGYAR